MRMRSVLITTALTASAVLGSAATASAAPADPLHALAALPFGAADAILNGLLNAGGSLLEALGLLSNGALGLLG
ncbi:hypothetical protein [Streptomyces sp. SID5643]|uniref:hypothetical protein n=1 Tax=Streptomyces sp. SID5643 TaxID=2690307 RepID=UPI0013704CB6|nr:hypothetical protein [Streptomyces sp. SID5643]MZF84363.1 hypothetical protein [Streptomyces sp. SID5643]